MNHEQWENWTFLTLPFIREDLGITAYAAVVDEFEGLVLEQEIEITAEVAMVIAERLIVASDLLGSAERLEALAEEISEELAELR